MNALSGLKIHPQLSSCIKKILGIIFICFFWLFANVLTFNFLMDPQHLFDSNYSYEISAAKIILDNSNVAIAPKCPLNERIFQKYVIQNNKEKPEIIILGSSRVMNIRATLFENKNMHNFGVSGASIEDILGFMHLIYTTNKKPDTILIGVDPWLFNANNGQTRWQYITEEYYLMLEELGISKKKLEIKKASTWDNLKKLVTLDYLKESVKKLIYPQLYNCYPTKNTQLDVSLFLSDGSIVYPLATQKRTLQKINDNARSMANSPNIYSLNQFKEIDQNLQSEFDSLIQHLLQQNIEVIFYLSPYHPFVYEKIEKSPEYHMVLAVEDYIQRYTFKYKIKVLGSYSPEKINIAEIDFYDGFHLRDSGVNKIFHTN